MFFQPHNKKTFHKTQLIQGTDERKKQWREWCNQYEKSVQDYNFGTLLRVDPDEDYTQENTIFCLRVQFLAIEIARNKEGLNKKICEKKPQTGGCCSRCWFLSLLNSYNMRIQINHEVFQVLSWA